MGRGQLQVSQNRIYRVKCFRDISHLVDGLKNIHFYLEISYLGSGKVLQCSSGGGGAILYIGRLLFSAFSYK